MIILALIVALLAPPATAAVPPEDEIVIRGHSWAPFISPMGEPFRAHTRTDDTLAKWFRQADLNQDGWLTAIEMQADAERFFAKLDSNQDSTIDPDELVRYEWDIAPDIQVNVRAQPKPGDPVPSLKRQSDDNNFHSRADEDEVDHGRRQPRRDSEGALQGAARYALLNMPEPVAAADLNFDRSITLAEFRRASVERFKLLDTGHAAALSLGQLDQQLASAEAAAKKRKHRKADDRDSRIGIPLPRDD